MRMMTSNLLTYFMIAFLGVVNSESISSTSGVNKEVSVTVKGDELVFTTPPSFLAYGWEPYTATGSFAYFNDDYFQNAMSHLSGAVRFGGITADMLEYIDDTTVSDQCKYIGHENFDGYECPFSTGSFDALLNFLSDAGLQLMFDFNEITGRDCTLPGPKPWQPAQYCGDNPAPWNTTNLKMFLEHIRDLNRDADMVGFELGNELFQPPHLTQDTAALDIATFSQLVEEVWTPANRTSPEIFAPGTNNCKQTNHSGIFEAVDSYIQGFSFHNYPEGDGVDTDDETKHDPETTVLNSTWLRYGAVETPQLCLDVWVDEGYKASGMKTAITETNANTGGGFGEGFFTVSILGQMAELGVSMVAHWSLTAIIKPGVGTNSDGDSIHTYTVDSDYFLNIFYAMTMGPEVLSVTGDEDSDVLVYAHCSAPSEEDNTVKSKKGIKKKIKNKNTDLLQGQGSVTLMVANPSSEAVTLTVDYPSLPRLEYVLTAPDYDITSATPVLNGNTEEPLVLSSDGSLPPMNGRLCTEIGSEIDNSEEECSETITVPPMSQSFFVLQGAKVPACM